MGTALARAFLRASHDVYLASRVPERARSRAAAEVRGAVPALPADAVSRADVAVLATRWEDTQAMLAEVGDFFGKVLIDATNPETADGRSLALGHGTSGGEEIARRAVHVRVVKAFNHVYAEILDRGASFSGHPAAVFLCGDDEEARRTVSRVAASCGFAPIDAGGLKSARLLEPLAMLVVAPVRGGGREPDSLALGLLERPGESGLGAEDA